MVFQKKIKISFRLSQGDNFKTDEKMKIMKRLITVDFICVYLYIGDVIYCNTLT